jgi:hypothetical protein
VEKVPKKQKGHERMAHMFSINNSNRNTTANLNFAIDEGSPVAGITGG